MKSCAQCGGPRGPGTTKFCSVQCNAAAQVGSRNVARFNRFKELREQGLSMSKIALKYYEETGEITTKNMVIGQLARVNGPGSNLNEANARRRLERQQRRQKLEREQARLASVEVGRIRIEDLASHTCRWPYGEIPNTTFCGEPCNHDVPYCDAHMAAAYQPESSLNRRKRYFNRHSRITVGFR